MNPFLNQVASKDTIELMAKFFDSATKALKGANFAPEAFEAVDLIQAISCYRYFPTVEQCIEAFPSLTQDKHKVEYIWEQFGKLTSRQLSDVYISSLRKLDFSDELTG